MTQISDDRLMEIKARGNQFVDKSRGSYGIPAIEMEQIIDELLSSRETIRRLVEVGRAMRNDVYAFRAPLPNTMIFNSTDLWDALLAELEGKGFETAMKRVLDENKGAWKALGGEEEKGSQLTESHGK